MNSNTFLLTVCGAMLVVTASAGPEVYNVVMEQDARSRVVTVTYDLGVEPAIVTLDILTNGVSIGAHNIYPKVVSCPLIDEMIPRLSKAPYPTLSIKLGQYQSRVIRSSI